jgi:hypothetical protein
MVIGTGFERAGRALRDQSGEPVPKTTPADQGDPPAHWLELLSNSQVPLVWMRQEADDAIQPGPQKDWEPRVPFQGERLAAGKEIADSEIPAGIDNVALHVPTFPTVFPETSELKLSTKIEGFQKTQEIDKTRQPGRSRQENKTPKARTGMSSLPQPSIPAKLQSAPRYKSRNTFRLLLTAKVSQPDHGQRAKQTVSNMPRYVHAQPQSRAELHWPEGSPQANAIAPRYETSQPSVAKEVSFLEASKESSANKNLFPEVPLSIDRWPSLPADWLATESEPSPTQLEQSHRQRLEQEWRGE